MNDATSMSSNSELLRQIADLLSIPSPSEGEWQAATVVLYSSDGELVATRVSHVQDIELDIAENALMGLAMSALRRHLGDTSPTQ